jgi:C4-type Zn-finger protein
MKAETVKCPNCKRILYLTELLLDVRYGKDGAIKVTICPHCLKDV